MKKKYFLVIILAVFLGNFCCFSFGSNIDDKKVQNQENIPLEDLKKRVLELEENKLNIETLRVEYQDSYNRINSIISTQNAFIGIFLVFFGIGLPIYSIWKNKKQFEKKINKFKNEHKINDEKEFEKEQVLALLDKNQFFRIDSSLEKLFSKYSLSNEEKYNFILKISRILMNKKEYCQPISLLNKATKICEDRGEAYVNLGNIHQQMNHFEIAKTMYDTAIKNNINLYSAYLNKSRTLIAIWESKKEIRYLEEAMETLNNLEKTNSNLDIVYKEKSKIYFNLKKYDLAIENINNAIALKETQVIDEELSYKSKILLEMGKEGSKQEKFEEALKCIDKALDINGEEIYYKSLKGMILLEANRNEEAIEIYYELLTRIPNDCSIYYNLACAYSKLKNSEMALRYFERALQNNYIDKNHILEDPDLEYLRISKIEDVENILNRYIPKEIIKKDNKQIDGNSEIS